MATMSLSILGLVNYLQDTGGDSLFKDMEIPEGVDATILQNNILMQASPFEILYPDPDVLRGMIGVWSNARLEFWEKVVDTWSKADDFNQLENFDRSEDETIEHSGTDTVGNTQTHDLDGKNNRTANLTQEHKVSAYDSSSYSPKDQQTTTGTDNYYTEDNGTITDQGATVYGHKIGRQARYHGNIGVTSLAQLIEGYNDVADRWDIYALITQEFIKEFCVMVY